VLEHIEWEDVQTAKNVLKNEMAAFGLTDRFDESLKLLRSIFGWSLGQDSKGELELYDIWVMMIV